MAGAAELVAALTGGKRIEQEAYDKAAQRLLAAREAQAAMDKKMMEAAILRDQLRSRQNAYNLRGDMDPLAFELMMAGIADQFANAQTGIGRSQQNEAREQAMEIARAVKGDPATRQNAYISVAGDKLLAPTNVNVGPQAQADFAKTVADTVAASNLAGERLAKQRETEAGMALNEEGEVIPELETLNSTLAGLLYLPPNEIPVTTERNVFSPNVVETLPMSDPRAAQAWADMTDDEKAEYMMDLAPEFLQWRTANIMRDRSLQDIDIAVGKFLESKGVTGGVQTGRAAQDARNNRTVYATPNEVQAAILAGELKKGDVIQTPQGPRVVK